jgi:hypothetical protein
LRKSENEILVQEIVDELGNPKIVPSTLNQDKLPEKLEARYRIVAHLNCLDALFPEDADAYVRGLL